MPSFTQHHAVAPENGEDGIDDKTRKRLKHNQQAKRSRLKRKRENELLEKMFGILQQKNELLKQENGTLKRRITALEQGGKHQRETNHDSIESPNSSLTGLNPQWRRLAPAITTDVKTQALQTSRYDVQFKQRPKVTGQDPNDVIISSIPGMTSGYISSKQCSPACLRYAEKVFDQNLDPRLFVEEQNSERQ